MADKGIKSVHVFFICRSIVDIRNPLIVFSAQEAADEFRHMSKVIEEVVLGSTKTQHQASINATRLKIEKEAQEGIKTQLASHKKALEERLKQTKKDVNSEDETDSDVS